MKKMMKKVTKHLKDDIKTFGKEAHDDKVLIGMIKRHKKSPKDNEAKESKKHEASEAKKEHKMPKGMAKIPKVMREFSSGSLHSGSKKGPLVKNKAQALAIGYSEARKAGARMPKKKK